MEGLGVYKYLQIFLVLVDVMELEDVGVLDELQDGDLPFHLGQWGDRGRQGSTTSPPPSPKGSPFP